MFEFEWHRPKARANERKHGISFPEAASAFDDPFSLTIPNPEHSLEEDRFVLIGRTAGNRIVVVVHTLRGETIRLISARPATRPRSAPMKKRRSSNHALVRREYDFSGGERGKYAGRIRNGARIVLLDPEVARVFPDSRSVNRALRLIAEIARKSLAR